jgi:tetratricopeptide (TPR) repeat protein
MLLDWLLVGLPVAATALVFSLALTTDPHDLIMRRITTPDSVAQRGYPADALADLLEDEVVKITDGATSLHHEHRIEIGRDDTAADQFANIINVLQPIRATQRLLGLVDHIADIAIVEHTDKTIVVHLRILAGDYAGTLKMTRTVTAEVPFEDTLSELAHEIVGVAEPYVMAAYLYNKAVGSPEGADFAATIAFVTQWLPRIQVQDRPWASNLLGLIAARSDEPEMAADHYRQALRWRSDFAPAHANWGRLLYGRGDLEGAIEHYRIASGLQPDLAINRVYLAQALVDEARFGQALAELDQARALAPELAQTYEIQAALYEHAGLPALAASERERAQLARARQPRQTYYNAM